MADINPYEGLETEEEKQAMYRKLLDQYEKDDADYRKAEYARQKGIYDLFADDLKRYRQVQLFEDKQFCKYIAMFAAGAFGVSFAFINDIVPFQGALHKGILLAAWACFAGALVITVAIHLVSSAIHGAYYDTISDNVQRGYDGEPYRQCRKWYSGWVMTTLYWLDFACFLGGMACLVIFVVLNI
jgi:hypothetical protein